MLNIFGIVGRVFLEFLAAICKVFIFTGNAVSHIFRPPLYFKLTLKQMVEIGFYSLPIVGLTAIFTGAVLALQSYTGFSRFNAESAIASVVVISITRELGPVLAGLMVAGRVGAAIAAEIGTMKVTEQVDALTTLSAHPLKYLVVPRILAAVLCMPILVLVSDIIGVYGGYLVGIHVLDFSSGNYLHSTFEFLETSDVVSGLIKAVFFGFIIAVMGCYNGYHSKGGAQGVGAATTNSVVMSSITILLMNYILTLIFFGG